MKQIDLNCDLGEGMPWDEAVMPWISSANIACGFHAGDVDTIRKTIDLCLQHNVAIGAHPGFDDKPNFGRKEIQLEDDALYGLIQRQLELMQKICDEKKAKLHHVKLHGALYNMAARSRAISKVAVQAVKDFNDKLFFYGLSGSVMTEEARIAGLKAVEEAFADRAYSNQGTLLPRNRPEAIIQEDHQALDQVFQILQDGSLLTIEGKRIRLSAETICIHGDESYAPALAEKIHKGLKQRGYRIETIK
ncbi:MAG: LamB/YcsF family protein [Cyclobacteriaceae bacterium]|nr:LamB/YcsF family protein [Cyclobacteriaceae bacterium]